MKTTAANLSPASIVPCTAKPQPSTITTPPLVRMFGSSQQAPAVELLLWLSIPLVCRHRMLLVRLLSKCPHVGTRTSQAVLRKLVPPATRPHLPTRTPHLVCSMHSRLAAPQTPPQPALLPFLVQRPMGLASPPLALVLPKTSTSRLVLPSASGLRHLCRRRSAITPTMLASNTMPLLRPLL